MEGWNNSAGFSIEQTKQVEDLLSKVHQHDRDCIFIADMDLESLEELSNLIIGYCNGNYSQDEFIAELRNISV